MDRNEIRHFIAKRTAKFFQDGDVVNLGIGMPVLCLDYIPEDIDVWVESENGILGITLPPENEDECGCEGKPRMRFAYAGRFHGQLPN